MNLACWHTSLISVLGGRGRLIFGSSRVARATETLSLKKKITKNMNSNSIAKREGEGKSGKAGENESKKT